VILYCRFGEPFMSGSYGENKEHWVGLSSRALQVDAVDPEIDVVLAERSRVL
jgi:hypothetical protein